jgi:hypothetical protein
VSKRFKVGDNVWVATLEKRERWVTCPVCAGNRTVTVILGSGEHVQQRCDYCGAGYTYPLGEVREDVVGEPFAKLVTIARVSAEDDGSGEKVRYTTDQSFVYDHGDVFADDEAALARASEMAAEVAERRARVEQPQKDGSLRLRTYAWSIGYHRREAKDLRRRAAQHAALGGICLRHVEGGEA